MGWFRTVRTLLMALLVLQFQGETLAKLYFVAMAGCLLLVNVCRYLLPRHIKQHAFALGLGLKWPKALIQKEKWQSHLRTTKGRALTEGQKKHGMKLDG